MLIYFTLFFLICQVFLVKLHSKLHFYVNCDKIYLSKAFSQANLFTLKWAEVFMKITRVTGYVWPLSITCTTCGITFEVDKPTDLRRHITYSYEQRDGITIPSEKRKYVTTSCPCCNKEHELLDSQVPAIFGTAIPFASGEVPFYG